MTWTTETPTVAGYYWLKTPKCWTPAVVLVDKCSTDGDRWLVWEIGQDDGGRVEFFREASWAGPLEAPA